MADSTVNIIVSAKDQATPTMDKVRQAFEEYKKSYETVGQFQARERAEAEALAGANDKLAASANQAASAHSKLSSSAEQVSTSNQGLFATFTAATVSAAVKNSSQSRIKE